MGTKRLRGWIAAFACIAMLLPSGCGKSDSNGANARINALSNNQRDAIATNIDSSLVQASNQFGIRLHEQLAQANQEQNLFICPLSISTAIAMAYNGANGATQREIAATMGWTKHTLNAINSSYSQILDLQVQPGTGIDLQLANSMWLKPKMKIQKPFQQALQNSYDAQASEVDWTNAEDTANQINNWVSKHTNGMIPTLLDPNAIDPSVVMMLLNAIYFKGEWQTPFEKTLTKEAPFHMGSGRTATASYMNQSGRYEHTRGEGYEAIRLPYGEGQMSMLIVLPGPKTPLAEIEKQITEGKLPLGKRWEREYGAVHLPKFKIEYASSLNQSLEALGIHAAFSPADADLSGITGVPGLYIDSVIHKSIIEVAEQGTEAAAVTSIAVGEAGAATPLPEPFDMRIDRPFFFLIEDVKSGLWLFTGSVYQPVES
ncbi:serpin family protein [Paenibacillus sp. MMS18-CY102]|uniref:serpin family protein n=1 Tax=Paenibacillus sp. MMS18-CY102 TaxID=2682849 RepID=UPI0013667CCD|nr:serpin family protein [Paenibacillus sp. MMS18-CY102]MWC29265.1 hypothetical protein [Paenibacillus sp. MMS18-CY102]